MRRNLLLVPLALVAAGLILMAQAAPGGGGAREHAGQTLEVSRLRLDIGTAASPAVAPALAPSTGIYWPSTVTTIVESAQAIASFSNGGGIAGLTNSPHAFYCAGGSSCGVQFGNAARLTTELADGAAAVGGISDTTTAWSTAGALLWSFRTNGVQKAAVSVNGAFNPDFTDDSATTGNRTVNKPSGINAFAGAATAITITNSVVKADSVVLAVLQTNDATARLANVVPAAGSFTINLTAAATGTTKVAWVVLNGN